MNIFALSGFINGISAIVFGFFVFSRNRKNLTNKTFGLMSLALAVWAFSYAFWQMSIEKESAMFWLRFLSIGSTFIPITFLHWVLVLYKKEKKRKIVISIGYIFAITLSLFSFSSLYIKNVVPRLSFLWWPEPGILYNIYLIIGYFGIIAYAFYELLKIYRASVGRIHEQIKYIFLAMILGFGGGATNFPLWYGIPIAPYGTFLVALYPFILSYAIIKYKLFEIKVVITSLFVGLIAILLLLDVIGSTSPLEYTWKGVLFVSFLVFGYLLTKSVGKEIRQREKMEKMTRSLERANVNLKKLDKAKSEFLSIASHQLRTPLSAIKGYLSMVLEGSYGKISSRLRKPISNVYEATQQLNQLVNTLLNISRIESGKIKLQLKMSSVQNLLRKMVEEFKIVAKKKNLYLKLELPASLPKIPLDEEKIRQVVGNIVDNAIKYTQEGGIKIKVIVKRSKVKQNLIIEITDTGVGMTKEETTNLFNKFSRGEGGEKLWTGGAGLGLYIARQFVELHGGKIWAKSKGKGKGSTFYIQLPLKQKI